MRKKNLPKRMLIIFIFLVFVILITQSLEWPQGYILSFIMLCLESIYVFIVIKKRKSKGIAINVINIISILSCILCFFHSEELLYTDLILSICLLDFVLNLIIALVHDIKNRIQEQTNLKENNYILPVLNKDFTETNILQTPYKKTYPIGVIDKKSNIIVSMFILATTIGLIAFIITFLLTQLLIFIILMCLYVFILTLIYLITFSNYVNKTINIYNQTLNYELLEESIFAIYNNPKVHNETKNYYLMLLAAIVFSIDQSKYKLYRSLVFCPKYKQYLVTYQTSFLNFLLTPEDFTKIYDELCSIYKSNRFVLRSLLEYYNRWKIVVLNAPCDDIDKICPLDHKIKTFKAANTYIQFIHFFNQGNYQKATELANLFMQYYSPLKLFAELINEKLEYINNQKEREA